MIADRRSNSSNVMGREVRMMENCGMDKGLGIGGDPVFTSGPLVVQF